MPLQRRVPKFGFKNPTRVSYKVINLDTIAALLETAPTEMVDTQFLMEHGLANKKDLVKVLGRGDLSKSISVKVHAFSASAKEAIEKAGGQALTL